MDYASCRDMAPREEGQEDIFFPGQGHSDHSNRAKAVCRQCPVLQECRGWRDEVGARYGVWAGEIATHGNKRTDRSSVEKPTS